MQNLVRNADYLAEKLEQTGKFEILSERGGKGVPLVAFSLKEKKVYNEVLYPKLKITHYIKTYILLFSLM